MLQGTFDSHGNACLNFKVHKLSDGTAVNLLGIIDTGFDGFIQIPLPVGLIMGIVGGSLTASKTRLADGKMIDVFLKTLPVTVGSGQDSETVDGVCQLPPSPGSPILIGMGFLRGFGRALLISYTRGILLPREADIAPISS